MPGRSSKALVALTLTLTLGASALTGVAAAWAADAPSVLPLKEFMAHVLQRNAAQLWAWSAYVSDEHGDRYTSPGSPGEWEDAESDALTLAELAQRLKIGDRRLDAQWDGYADALRAAALRSAAAAERHDLDALVSAGNDLSDRCVACHLRYVPELEGAPRGSGSRP